jgi:hypothetical protein
VVAAGGKRRQFWQVGQRRHSGSPDGAFYNNYANEQFMLRIDKLQY